MADMKEWLKNSKALPMAVLGGIITTVGVASIGLLAAGKVAGDFLSLLALGGGFACVAMGGNVLFTAHELWKEEEKALLQRNRENEAQSHTRSNSLERGISKALSRTTGQRSSEFRADGEVQLYPQDGKPQRTATYINGRRIPKSGKQGGFKTEYIGEYVDGRKVSDSKTDKPLKKKGTNNTKGRPGKDDR